MRQKWGNEMRYLTVICDSCKDLIHNDAGVTVGYNPYGIFSKPRELDFHKVCADNLETKNDNIDTDGWIMINP